MPTRTLPKRFDLSKFNALIITKNRKTGYLNLYISAAEEEEIDRLTEENLRNNYEAEYKMACDKAEDHWYPYRAAKVLDDQLIDFWKSSDVDKIIKHRWSSLRKEMQSKYLSEQVMPELNKAVQRRAMLEPKYES